MVTFICKALSNKIGCANTNGITMRLVAEVEHHCPLAFKPAAGVRCGKQTGNIGIVAVSAEIFADLVDDQYFPFGEQDLR